MNYITYLIFSLLTVSATAQDTIPMYPKGDFRSPLDIPLILSGSFGEPRRSHFHNGLDIRTQEKEGLNVYAVADGYVSRINVSPGGYGNALYITHLNGFTTVYGHLLGFNDTITSILRKRQYEGKRFAVDILLKPDMIPVKKGDVVAYSGNTGGSGGPHLHFEIRDVLERPINPFLFGIAIPDHIAPLVGGLKIYPLDSKRFFAAGYRVAVVKGAGDVYQTTAAVIKVNSPTVGIAVNTFDKMDNGIHSLGLFQLRLFDGDSLLYQYSVARLSFDYTRCVIAQVDYPIFLKEGSRSFQKCFVELNNKLPAAYRALNRGLINVADNKVHHIRIEATDYCGNIATVKTSLQYDPAATTFVSKEVNYVKVLSPDIDNRFSTESFSIHIPGSCLLDTIYANYVATAPKSPSIISMVHKFDESYNQLMDYADVSIKPTALPDKWKDKAIIIWQTETGGIAARASKWEGEMLTAKTRELGSYYVMLDTTPPKIKPINITNGKNMHLARTIIVKIADNLSGIEDFDATIDNIWQLMELDGKTGTLKMEIPATLSAGEHSFKLIVTDGVKNKAVYSVIFNY